MVDRVVDQRRDGAPQRRRRSHDPGRHGLVDPEADAGLVRSGYLIVAPPGPDSDAVRASIAMQLAETLGITAEEFMPPNPVQIFGRDDAIQYIRPLHDLKLGLNEIRVIIQGILLFFHTANVGRIMGDPDTGGGGKLFW